MTVSYYSEETKVTVIMTEHVADYLREKKQRRGRERGGQLFGRIDDQTATLTVTEVTGGKPSLLSGLFFYKPNIKHEQKEIDGLYAQGLHYLGDWHTHPEQNPTPSAIDVKYLSGVFRKSQKDIRYFIMCIVGLAEPDDDFYLGLQNSQAHFKMNLVR